MPYIDQAALELADQSRREAAVMLQDARALRALVTQDKAALQAMLQGLGVVHRWNGTALEILGPEGWGLAVDLRGVKGNVGDPGPSLELRNTGEQIQWRVAGSNDPWSTLFTLLSVQGPVGPGVEVRQSGAFVQWRRAGSIDPWTNLFALDDVRGPQGIQGIPGPVDYTLGFRATVTGNYTLQASDKGLMIPVSSAVDVTITLPNSIAAGFNCMVVQEGVGAVIFSAAAGATYRERGGNTRTAGQHAIASLITRANSTGTSAIWLASGDLTF